MSDAPSPFEHDPIDDDPCQKTWGWHDEHWCDEQNGHESQHFCPCGDERDLDSDQREADDAQT